MKEVIIDVLNNVITERDVPDQPISEVPDQFTTLDSLILQLPNLSNEDKLNLTEKLLKDLGYIT